MGSFNISIICSIIWWRKKAKRLSHPEIPYSTFLTNAQSGTITEITITGSDIYGQVSDGSKFFTYIPANTDAVADIKGYNITIQGKPIDNSPTLTSILLSLLPIFVLIAFWVFFMKKNEWRWWKRSLRFWSIKKQKLLK